MKNVLKSISEYNTEIMGIQKGHVFILKTLFDDEEVTHWIKVFLTPSLSYLNLYYLAWWWLSLNKRNLKIFSQWKKPYYFYSPYYFKTPLYQNFLLPIKSEEITCILILV